MPDIVSAADIPALLVNDTPLLDVRAPIEFSRGAFPTATNLPLLIDSEREAVGRIYKEHGKEAAIAHGEQLLSAGIAAAETIKTQRVNAWQGYIAVHPGSVLYCYRGGLRSETAQNWLAEAGVTIPRVTGGYKRMRRELLNTIDHTVATTDFMIVAGKTGSGKTHLINALRHSIDLEGLANHRGSAFGTRVTAQPTQINFENALAIALLKLPSRLPRRLFLEDESRAIGSLSLPQALYGKMTGSPIALLEESLEQRVDTILNDYIVSNFLEFKRTDLSNYEQRFADYLLASLKKIQRRLGGDNFQELRHHMEQALADSRDNLEGHKEWIRLLLQKYYDPMYDYQLNKKTSRVVFRGDRDELLRWASHLDVPAVAAHG